MEKIYDSGSGESMKNENIDKNLLEALAELEHEQWIFWSRNIAETETITEQRLERWKKLWVPYRQLTEEQKASDRLWAEKVLKIFEE
jgi:hypothetical protein